MSSTKIYYYINPSGNNVVREFILSLEKNQQVKVRRQLQVIEEYGLSSAIPHIKKLSGTPFWEIRILGRDNIRIIYVTLDYNSILVLHGFIKKTQKTSNRELNIAFKRFKEWKLSH